MKTNKKTIILLIAAFFAVLFLRDFAIKSLVGTVTTVVTGAPTRIGGLSLSLFKQSIKMSNFRIYNPAGFPRDILVDIPHMYVSCNLASVFKGKLHIKQIDFDLKEVGMAKNKDGKTNVDSLKIAQDQPKEGEKKPGKQMPMRIEIVNLSIGRIVSKDYSVEPPVIKVYEINIKKTYKDINSAQQLAALIISEPLKAAGIQGLKVYGVSMLAGVAALPVAAAFTFTGKDFDRESFNVNIDKAYKISLKVLKQSGTIKSENEAEGVISALVSGAQVNLKLRKVTEKTTEITVSARKLVLPQPEVASGVMYRIADELE